MDSSENVVLEYRAGEGCFYLQVPFSRRNEVKKIGGLWTQSTKSWRFPVDLNIWEDVRRVFGGHGTLLVAKPFLAEIRSLETRQKELEEMKTLAEEDSPVEFGVDGVSLDGKNPLFNYQRWGVKCALQGGEGFLIGDVPGLGKSIQALSIAISRKNSGDIQNCLIVCPASLKYNWLNEIHKFTKETALIVEGTPARRRKCWMAKGYFFKIANYETIVGDLFIDTDSHRKNKRRFDREETDFRKFMQKSFDMVVVDEIHAIKHYSSQRSDAIKQLRSKYRLGLSGTPVDGKLEELHSIFEYIRPGLFESRSRFIDNHAVKDFFGTIKGYINVQQVRDRISPYYIRRTKEKVLKDLPDKLYKDVYVELDPPEMKLYRELIDGASSITEEQQALVKILRVRQFLDFPELLKMHNKSCKFLALAELLEELVDGNSEKCLLFTQYKEVLDLLYFNLKGRYNILQIHGDVKQDERFDIVEQFNSDPKWNILLGTDAMSTGLNIGGANSVIHYEDNFSPAIMQQRNDRAHRATTRHNVTIYRFICKGTIEENIRGALGNKMNLNNAVLDERCTEFGVNSIRGLDLIGLL